jgi:hypothetical protein
MPHSNGKAPVLGGTEASSDLLAGGIESHVTADLALVADDAWRVLIGQLLSSPPIGLARRHLDQLPTSVANPVLNWWLSGIRLSVAAEIVPNPLTASAAAINAGLQTPPALRGLVTDAGWALVSAATPVPFCCAGDFIEIIRDAEVHRAAEKALAAMSAVVWRADPCMVAEVFQRETGAVLALFAEVTHHAHA